MNKKTLVEMTGDDHRIIEIKSMETVCPRCEFGINDRDKMYKFMIFFGYQGRKMFNLCADCVGFFQKKE